MPRRGASGWLASGRKPMPDGDFPLFFLPDFMKHFACICLGVALLAGAEAAVYVGGSSTEGSPCACQSQTWSFGTNPYRRLSVGASLGAEVRYRLGEGGNWELLAQPTATYLLSPLAPATSAYYQRHLFGGAVLLGVAFNLP